MVPATAKVEMARRLSKLHGLGFRDHDPDEIGEHYARNSSSSFADAFAERTRWAGVLFCNRRNVWNSFMGYLEG